LFLTTIVEKKNKFSSNAILHNNKGIPFNDIPPKMMNVANDKPPALNIIIA